jgi:hypothetical protein
MHIYRCEHLGPASSPRRATRADAPHQRRRQRPLPLSPSPRRHRSRPPEACAAHEDGGGGAVSSPLPSSSGRGRCRLEGTTARRAVAARAWSDPGPQRPDPVVAGPDLSPVAAAGGRGGWCRGEVGVAGSGPRLRRWQERRSTS